MNDVLDETSEWMDVLGNHIILQLVLESLSSAKDIATLASLSTVIRATTLSIIDHVHIERLSFARTKAKNKHILSQLFRLLEWRNLVILDLSGTAVTSGPVRSLLLNSTSLKVLQLVGCTRVSVNSIIMLLKTMRKKAHAPITYLDIWDIDGLRLDYKYQNTKIWMYESFCNDNRNLMSVLSAANEVSIDLNIHLCHGSGHGRHDVRYIPAVRGRLGLTQCELYNDPVCETCILRRHNEAHNKAHQCRTPIPIEYIDL